MFFHTKTRFRYFLHSSGLNSVIEKPRFRDGLVCTVGLGVKIKLRFQISPEQRGSCLRQSKLWDFPKETKPTYTSGTLIRLRARNFKSGYQTQKMVVNSETWYTFHSITKTQTIVAVTFTPTTTTFIHTIQVEEKQRGKKTSKQNNRTFY